MQPNQQIPISSEDFYESLSKSTIVLFRREKVEVYESGIQLFSEWTKETNLQVLASSQEGEHSVKFYTICEYDPQHPPGGMAQTTTVKVEETEEEVVESS